jgi:hypothetical protein
MRSLRQEMLGNRCISYAGLAVWLLLIGGCNPARQHLEQFNTLFLNGQYQEASQFCAGRISDPNKASGDNLLWALQMGSVQRVNRNYAESNLWFDRCEELMKTFDPQSRQTDVVGTTLVNDTIIPYRGQIYDGIMVNTYKAMNFLALGNTEYARVELNRAMERQSRAKDAFNEEIQKEQEKLDKEKTDKKESQTFDYQKTVENEDAQARIRNAYPGLSEFEAYPDFVNPYSTYLAGIYFLMSGDAGKSRDLLKECAAMMTGNPYIQADFAAADEFLMDDTPPPPTVWVFLENGVGPVKAEFRVDLPLFLFTGKVYYAGIALPKLVERPAATERLTLQIGNDEFASETVADMDRVVKTEFAKEYPWIVTRAVISGGTKAAVQYAILEGSRNNNNNGGAIFAAAIMAVYSLATTTADMRIWTALPKNIQVTRAPMPADGQITLRTSQGAIHTLNVGSGKHAIVIVQMITALTEPRIEVLTIP